MLLNKLKIFTVSIIFILLSTFSLVLKWNSIVLMMISLELMMISLFFNLFFNLFFKEVLLWFLLSAVLESCFGLMVLVMNIRFLGNDLMISFLN